VFRLVLFLGLDGSFVFRAVFTHPCDFRFLGLRHFLHFCSCLFFIFFYLRFFRDFLRLLWLLKYFIKESSLFLSFLQLPTLSQWMELVFVIFWCCLISYFTYLCLILFLPSCLVFQKLIFFLCFSTSNHLGFISDSNLLCECFIDVHLKRLQFVVIQIY
jgi:hypothetical protein